MNKKFLFLICLVGSLILAGTASAELVARWSFDEGSGSTAADVSGNGHDGTLNGDATWAEGVYGGALELDGSGDYVMCGLVDVDTAVSGGMSVTAWIYKPAGGDIKMCSNRQGDNAAGGGFTCSIYNDHMEMDISSATARNLNRDTDGAAVPGSTWVHLAWILDDVGDTFNEYHNGVLIDSSAESVSVGVSTAEFRIGGDSPGLGYYFNGMIDDLRIYDHVLTEAELADVMAGKIPGGESANSPYPAHEAVDVPRDTILSWTPGEYAATHDVYFGMAFDDVNDASRDEPMNVLASQGQAGATYTPTEALEYGQIYYWRVDEVNAAPDNTIFKGAVWSFTAEPFAYAVENITATSNTTSAADQGPEKAVDGSGLNDEDQHSTNLSQMWLGAINPDEPSYIAFEFDRVYKLHEMLVWNHNMDFEMWLGIGIKDATIEYSQNGADWTVLDDVVLNQAPARSTYVSNTTVPLDGVAAKYVRLTVGSTYLSTDSVGLAEVRFMYIPAQAREPQPADAAVDVAPDSMLSWRSGRDATSHEVYLGTDPNAMLLAGTTTGASFDPAGLDLGATYYWKVDEVNPADTAAWTGALWSFSTQAYIEIDGFESYDDDYDAGTAVWQTWLDGLEDNANGVSYVGHDPSPFSETTIVHSGNQSMPWYFDNADASAISETDRIFDSSQDWTANGIKSLSFWFHGYPGNTGQLYVKINETKVLYDGDAGDIGRTQWMPWNVDLTTVGGNLSNVTAMSIGVQGVGSGLLYIDDVRLYPIAPAGNTAIEPDAANLVAHYTFDGGLQDSVGGFDGVAIGAAAVGNDATRGSVLTLDGFGAAVEVPLIGEANEVTICMWAKSDVDLTSVQFASTFHSSGWEAGDVHFRYSYGVVNGGLNGVEPSGDLNGSGLVQPEEWNHVAMTVSQAGAAVWLNGQAEDSRVLTAAVPYTLGDGYIGAYLTTGAAVERSFTGQIDDARIYNKALSGPELSWLAGKTGVVYEGF